MSSATSVLAPRRRRARVPVNLACAARKPTTIYPKIIKNHTIVNIVRVDPPAELSSLDDNISRLFPVDKITLSDNSLIYGCSLCIATASRNAIRMHQRRHHGDILDKLIAAVQEISNEPAVDQQPTLDEPPAQDAFASFVPEDEPPTTAPAPEDDEPDDEELPIAASVEDISNYTVAELVEFAKSCARWGDIFAAIRTSRNDWRRRALTVERENVDVRELRRQLAEAREELARFHDAFDQLGFVRMSTEEVTV